MKIIRLLLTTILLLASIISFSQHQQIFTSNTYWELVINGGDTTLKITGSGEIPNFNSTTAAPWANIRLNLKFLEIGDSITKIGSYVFIDCSGLTGTLTLPNSLTSIADRAFSDCSGLTGTLTIPNSVVSIDNLAFNNCSGLTTLNLPNSLTYIEMGAFCRCSGLTLITFPIGLDSIRKYTFWDCRGLTSITLPAGLTSIGTGAFLECRGLTSITLPAGLTSIEKAAFKDCSGLNEIINLNPIPLSIDSGVFQGVIKSMCKLKVPTVSLTSYQQAPVWQDFLIEGGGVSVTTLSNDRLQGTVNGISNRFYTVGENVTLQATPNTVYKFKNWTSKGAIISMDNPFSFTVTQDTIIMANFDNDVSIKERNPQANKIILYPNPVKDMIHIQSFSKVEQVTIYNLSGKMLKQISNIQKSISLDDLAVGMYLVKVITEDGETVRKIIKQ